MGHARLEKREGRAWLAVRSQGRARTGVRFGAVACSRSSLLAQMSYARGWCEVCAQSLYLVYSIDVWACASRCCCWIKLDSPAADAHNGAALRVRTCIFWQARAEWTV